MSDLMLGRLLRQIMTVPTVGLGTLCDLTEKLASSSGLDWLEELRHFCRKEPCWQTLVTTSDSIVYVDRAVRPGYPTWMKSLMRPDLESCGPTEFDLAKLELWLHPAQKSGSVSAKIVYDWLVDNDMFPSCLGLRDLEEIQKKGVSIFLKYFHGKVVYGWKSVVQYGIDRFHVPYLLERNGRVELEWSWIESNLFANDFALRFPKKPVPVYHGMIG